MDRAKENYVTGKNRTVTAEEVEKIYMGTVPSNKKRFFCPHCGEYVSFVWRKKYKSYFRHCNSNETTKICDLRSEAHLKYTIYERLGLPLYLKNCKDGRFELYLGFYNIDEWLMNIAKRGEFKVRITSLNNDEKLTSTYYINDDNFSTTSITLKNIDFASSKYKLEYISSNADKLLNRKWGREAEGIFNGEALFTYGINGGRKIRVNEEITTETEYYYLCRNNNFDRYNGIKYEKQGEIILKSSYKSSVFNIYKISFQAYNDAEFNRLCNFCRDNLKVSLIYNPSELIPIWPPPIKKDNEIAYLKEVENALFVLKSDQISPKIFMHFINLTDELVGENLNFDRYLIKIPITKEKVAVNINEKYNSIFAFLSHYKATIRSYNNNVYVVDLDNNLIEKGKYTKLPSKRSIKVISQSRCNIIHLKKNQIHQLIKIKSEKGVILNEIDYGDEIIASNGIKNISLVQYVENKIENSNSFNDELTYLCLLKMGQPFMATPMFIKKLLSLLESDYKTYKLIRKFLIKNKMPISAYNILKDLYRIMDRGGYNEYK